MPVFQLRREGGGFMSPPLSIIEPQRISLRSFIALIGFSLLTGLGAQLRVYLPFTPVPITLQTFFVLLSGAILGRSLGGLSQVVYLVLGSFSNSLFAGSLGLFGPTGGYLIGFVVASWITGKLLEGDRFSLKRVILAMMIGNLSIYGFGLPWLSIYLGYSIRKAILLGFLPFVIGDFIKLLGASFVYKALKHRR